MTSVVGRRRTASPLPHHFLVKHCAPPPPPALLPVRACLLAAAVPFVAVCGHAALPAGVRLPLPDRKLRAPTDIGPTSVDQPFNNYYSSTEMTG